MLRLADECEYRFESASVSFCAVTDDSCRLLLSHCLDDDPVVELVSVCCANFSVFHGRSESREEDRALRELLHVTGSCRSCPDLIDSVEMLGTMFRCTVRSESRLAVEEHNPRRSLVIQREGGSCCTGRRVHAIMAAILPGV
jgi:hypothetical protein